MNRCMRFAVLLCLCAASLLFVPACGGGGGAGEKAEGSNWNEMQWNEGTWGPSAEGED